MKLKNKISSNSYIKIIWHRLMKNKMAKFSIWILITLFSIGVLSPLIANQKPYYIKVYNHTYFPIFHLSNQILFFNEMGEPQMLDKQQIDWKHLPYQSALFAPIAYAPNTSDILNANYLSPFEEQLFLNRDKNEVQMPLQFKHWLGTNKRGEDVASGLISGISSALLVGIFSMLLAALIGVSAGLCAGYFGNDTIKIKKGTAIFLLVGIVLAWFYGFQIRWYILSEAWQTSVWWLIFQLSVSVAISIIVLFLGIIFCRYTINRIQFFKTEIFVPIDFIIIKIIEIVVSLPIMILVISLAAITQPSYLNLILIIGVLQSANIARIIRAEMLRIKNVEYMQAAQILGVSQINILLKYALPNTISSAISSISFGIAQSILIESSLSFLNIGLPAGAVSWGTLINAGCENFNAWWLVILPGLAIFITVLIFNILGKALHQALLVNSH
ncbi:MAG: hypothetical protein RIQ33_234 [Bacteroidota bacterium]|jgi:peptide/nickel transport system permease protein